MQDAHSRETHLASLMCDCSAVTKAGSEPLTRLACRLPVSGCLHTCRSVPGAAAHSGRGPSSAQPSSPSLASCSPGKPGSSSRKPPSVRNEVSSAQQVHENAASPQPSSPLLAWCCPGHPGSASRQPPSPQTWLTQSLRACTCGQCKLDELQCTPFSSATSP